MSNSHNVKIPKYDIFSMVDNGINICRSSGYINKNAAYRNIVKNIHYTYMDEPIINSFAGKKDGISSVYSCEGLCTMLSIYSPIFGYYINSKNASLVRQSASWICDNMIASGKYGDSVFSVIKYERIRDFYTKFPMYSSENMDSLYKELTVKSIAGIIGHETGHICLGHVDNSERSDNNISRNDERSADLFACSILQGTGIGSSFVDGMLLMTLAIYFMEGDDTGYETHPSSTERVMNIIRSFKNELEFSNIHESDILKIIG